MNKAVARRRIYTRWADPAAVIAAGSRAAENNNNNPSSNGSDRSKQSRPCLRSVSAICAAAVRALVFWVCALFGLIQPSSVAARLKQIQPQCRCIHAGALQFKSMHAKEAVWLPGGSVFINRHNTTSRAFSHCSEPTREPVGGLEADNVRT